MGLNIRYDRHNQICGGQAEIDGEVKSGRGVARILAAEVLLDTQLYIADAWRQKEGIPVGRIEIGTGTRPSEDQPLMCFGHSGVIAHVIEADSGCKDTGF